MVAVKKQSAEELTEVINYHDYLQDQGRRSARQKSLREFEILHKDFREEAKHPEGENLIDAYKEAQRWYSLAAKQLATAEKNMHNLLNYILREGEKPLLQETEEHFDFDHNEKKDGYIIKVLPRAKGKREKVPVERKSVGVFEKPDFNKLGIIDQPTLASFVTKENPQ